LLIGAVPTTARAAALTVDFLLDHPDLLKQAQEAARQDNIALLNQFVLETLRFTPFAPVIFRRCLEDYRLASGTDHARTIKAGKSVIVVTQAAMLDGDHVDDPAEFKLDRPAHVYMHYGYGLHTCFGQHINAVQIATIVKTALMLPNLRRAGSKQEADARDPFNMSVEVCFDA
jgi:cytochrome P450